MCWLLEHVNLPLFVLPGLPCFLPEPLEIHLDPSLWGSVHEISGPHGNCDGTTKLVIITYNNKFYSKTKPKLKVAMIIQNVSFTELDFDNTSCLGVWNKAALIAVWFFCLFLGKSEYLSHFYDAVTCGQGWSIVTMQQLHTMQKHFMFFDLQETHSELFQTRVVQMMLEKLVRPNFSKQRSRANILITFIYVGQQCLVTVMQRLH